MGNVSPEFASILESLGFLVAMVALGFLCVLILYICCEGISNIKKKRKIIKRELKVLTDDKIFRFVEEARREFEGDSSNN